MYIDEKRVLILRALIEESEYFVDDIDNFKNNNGTYLTKFDDGFFDDKDKLIIIDDEVIDKETKKSDRTSFFLGIITGFVFGIFTFVFYFLLRKKTFLWGIIIGSICQILISVIFTILFT